MNRIYICIAKCEFATRMSKVVNQHVVLRVGAEVQIVQLHAWPLVQFGCKNKILMFLDILFVLYNEESLTSNKINSNFLNECFLYFLHQNVTRYAYSKLQCWKKLASSQLSILNDVDPPELNFGKYFFNYKTSYLRDACKHFPVARFFITPVPLNSHCWRSLSILVSPSQFSIRIPSWCH